MTGKVEDNLGMFWKTSQLGIYWKISGRKRRSYRMIWFTRGKGMIKDDWLVVWNMNFMSPCIWNNHPNWRTPSFFRGVGIPPTSIVFRIAPNIFIYFLYPPYGIQDWVIFFGEQMSIWVLDTSSLMDPKAMASPRNIEKIKLECPGGLGLVRTWIRGNPKLELHHALLVLWRIKHPNIG